MQKWFFLLLLISVGFASCSSTKTVRKTTKRRTVKIDKIVVNAIKYKGIPYKFGGTTKRGMDCSGIVYVSYLKEKVQLPRVSIQDGKEREESVS
jgi:probable lipoprotein NlpC